MAESRTRSAPAPDAPIESPSSDPARAEVEKRIGEARASINQTVERLTETVHDQVDAVTTTVSGVLTMSEQFQREPLAWSLGALSAGFAMGYSLGRAHHVKTKRGRPSPLARMADDVATELATFGSSLVSPALSEELKAAFGVDLSAALAQIAARQVPRARTGKTKPAPKRRVGKRAGTSRRRRA